ncbi:hypothetical protein SCHPADRAFT_836987, partial [Schizopora paradoxa]
MPPKRRRVSESSQTKEDDGNKGNSSSGPRPHDKFWYSDGSIVLATDVHLYRVHRSMLAQYSKVLSDIFEMPTGDSNADCWEDVPIVRMVGDTDDEVQFLLKALYHRNFQNTLHDLEIPVISSLLSISTKYDFHDIREEVLHFLESIFPSTLKDFEESRK